MYLAAIASCVLRKTKNQSCLHVPFIQEFACSVSMYALFSWHACMHVYTTSAPCQSDISKTTSNCNMEVDQRLSSSSNDVIDTSLTVKSSVAATCMSGSEKDGRFNILSTCSDLGI